MAKRIEESVGKRKPAEYEKEYEFNRILELAKCKIDIIYFVETYCKIIHPKRGVVPFKLYEYQRRLLRAYAENDRVITWNLHEVSHRQYQRHLYERKDETRDENNRENEF